MISRESKTRLALAAAPLLFGLAFVAGCDPDSYPQDLKYPVRNDPFATNLLTSSVSSFDRPGDLDHLLVNLPAPERKKIYDGAKDQLGADVIAKLSKLPEEDFKKLTDPARLEAAQRQAIATGLDELFGKPSAPKSGVKTDVEAALKLDERTLTDGSKLYRQHCLHCHGLTGDGRGPTGPWVNPHPRDYRQGLFKFTSTAAGLKPHREDLLRTIREGIESTSMPSFRLLPENDVEAITSYVVHLALRGEAELNSINAAVTEKLTDLEELKGRVKDYTELFAMNWVQAQGKAVAPKPNPYTTEEARRQAAQRGQKKFLEAGDASCISCHVDFGRQSTLRWDAWGTIVKPADLTRNAYRGGRRPLDLFWRIKNGINGAGMPAFGQLTDEQIWDLVHFVQVMPYPAMHKDYGVELKAKQ